MRRTIPHTLAILALLASAVAASPILEEGFAVDSASEVIVTGSVFDSAAGTPIAAAQVTLLSQTTTDRTTTGPDGVFRLSTTSTEKLGTLSIEVSAYGYQPKYVETLLRDAFRHRIDAQVGAGAIQVKARKFTANLACGAAASVETKSGGQAPVAGICSEGLAGLELTIRKNRVAVLAAPPYSIRVENGRIALGGVTGGRVELRIDAAMLPR